MLELAPVEYHKSMSWYDALLYCQFLEIDGVTGWRLPTLLELSTLSFPVDDELHHWNDDGAYYWSSNVRVIREQEWALTLSEYYPYSDEEEWQTGALKSYTGNVVLLVRVI